MDTSDRLTEGKPSTGAGTGAGALVGPCARRHPGRFPEPLACTPTNLVTLPCAFLIGVMVNRFQNIVPSLQGAVLQRFRSPFHFSSERKETEGDGLGGQSTIECSCFTYAR